MTAPAPSRRLLSSLRPASTTSSVCKMTSAAGRLKTEHFVLAADRLELELDAASFELLAARASGNVEVQMATADGRREYVALAQSATYQTDRKRLILGGWKGANINGVHRPSQGDGSDVILPTDGSFL